MNSPERIKRIIGASIRNLDLDLTGYTILTELGSNYFLYTPIIALMANAKRVYAWTRDSRFGKGSELVEQCKVIAASYGLEDRMEYAVNDRPLAHIDAANIITNLGFVRPLNRDLLEHVNSSNAVIPAMCEAWEIRTTDIDVNFCREKNIPVAGTWENHPDLKIFDGCGPLAIKMMHEAGYEVYQNTIIVWSNDHFGEVVSAAFKNFGAKKVTLTCDPVLLNKELEHADAIFFCDYKEQRQIIGREGIIDITLIKNNSVGVVHLYGDIDNDCLKGNGVSVYPDKRGHCSVMTFTLAHLGPIPLINLHAAGFKVGENLLKGINSELTQTVSP